LLDTEEYEEKKYSDNYQVGRSLTTHNKYSKQYEYDNINKTYGYKQTVCNYFLAAKPCEISEIFTSVYTKDSLYRIDKRTLYSLNNPYTTYFSETFYAYCTPTVSDVKEVVGSVDFNISPNPTTGYFNLSISEEARQSGASVSVYNIQGGEVFKTKLTSESTAIDLSNLSKGFYLVKVADKTHSSVKKLVLN
jgi:Secretion system C-terminal sorting domain